MTEAENRLKLIEDEIERRLVERFAGLRDEFDRLRLEADRRWAGFLDRFDQKFSGIVPAELMADEREPQTSRGTLPAEAARVLDAANSQVEALHGFLDLCGRFASRAALLVARGEAIGVWKAVGFSAHGGNDESVRRATTPSGAGTVLERVMEGHPCELAGGNEISTALTAGDCVRAVLIPMVVKEKISGALYADCVASEESRFDPEALAFLTFLAGLVVDRLAGRKLKPAPPLRALETTVQEAAQPLMSAPSQLESTGHEPEFELAEEGSGVVDQDVYGTQMTQMPPPVETPPPPPQFYGIPSAIEPPPRPTQAPFEPLPRESNAAARPERPLELAVEAEPLESSVPTGTVRIPTSRTDKPAAVPPEPAKMPAPAPAPPSELRVSSGARRLAGPLAPADGDERRDEARRFAKLLVSEIKLYNEKAVVQGREHGNIYTLLKEDIDRSRQMYDERIPQDVRAGSNFFYEELVRILADGRREALGL